MSGWLDKTMKHLEAYPITYGLAYIETLEAAGADVDPAAFDEVPAFLRGTGGGYACSLRDRQVILTDHNGEEFVFPTVRAA